jgi:hypothetical protein
VADASSSARTVDGVRSAKRQCQGGAGRRCTFRCVSDAHTMLTEQCVRSLMATVRREVHKHDFGLWLANSFTSREATKRCE